MTEMPTDSVDDDRRTPLCLAAWRGDVEATRNLLAQRADVNAKDKYSYTPLHLAVQRGVSEEIVRLLIEAGANVNAADYQGFAPLHYATGKENHAMMKALIVAGADVNACPQDSKEPHLQGMTSDRRTPLCLAAWNDDLEGVKLLLKAGADPMKGKWPGTGLVHAEHSPEILRLLMDASPVTVRSRWPDKGRGR